MLIKKEDVNGITITGVMNRKLKPSSIPNHWSILMQFIYSQVGLGKLGLEGIAECFLAYMAAKLIGIGF